MQRLVEEVTKVDDFLSARAHDRIAFLRDHIAATYRAIREGVRLNGYFVWTIIDNFEWAEGYSKRFGLVHTIKPWSVLPRRVSIGTSR